MATFHYVIVCYGVMGDCQNHYSIQFSTLHSGTNYNTHDYHRIVFCVNIISASLVFSTDILYITIDSNLIKFLFHFFMGIR